MNSASAGVFASGVFWGLLTTSDLSSGDESRNDFDEAQVWASSIMTVKTDSYSLHPPHSPVYLSMGRLHDPQRLARGRPGGVSFGFGGMIASAGIVIIRFLSAGIGHGAAGPRELLLRAKPDAGEL